MLFSVFLFPKWPRFKYSFVFTQISPWGLVLKCKIQKNILPWKRHQGLIWIITKKYLNGGHFRKRCVIKPEEELLLWPIVTGAKHAMCMPIKIRRCLLKARKKMRAWSDYCLFCFSLDTKMARDFQTKYSAKRSRSTYFRDLASLLW